VVGHYKGPSKIFHPVDADLMVSRYFGEFKSLRQVIY